MQSKFIKHTLLFASATLISRIFGYIRDAVIAFVFGASYLTDAFFVAWRLPNTLRQLVAEGSFSAVFIPIYTSLERNNPQKAKEYISSLFSFYVLILSLITLVVILFSKLIVVILAPGFLKEKDLLETASNLVKIVFPYLVLVGIVSFFTAVVNTKNRFFIPAVSPALLNLSFIFFALTLSEQLGIYSIALGALFGGLLQVILTFFLFKKEGYNLSISFKLLDEIKLTLKRITPAFLSFGVSQFGFVIDTILASLIMAGAISYLYYANRIFQLPIGIFAVGLGNSLLVSLSKYYTEQKERLFDDEVNKGLKMAIILSLPATFGMIVLGSEIIDILFNRGAFTQKDAIYTYYALVGYALGLTFYTLTRPLKSAFFAVEDVKVPLYSTVAGILGGVFFAVVFVFIFNMGVIGLSLASSIAGLISFLYLYAFYFGNIYKRQILITFVKAFFSSFIMAIIIVSLKLLIKNEYVLIGLSISVGAVSYFLLLLALREDIVKEILSYIKRKKI